MAICVAIATIGGAITVATGVAIATAIAIAMLVTAMNVASTFSRARGPVGARGTRL